MRHAIASFKEAFAAFKEKPKEFAILSIVASFFLSIVLLIASFILFASGLMGAGAINKIASSAAFNLEAAALIFASLVMLAVILFFGWIFCGAIGAYFDSVNSLCAKRKHSIEAFLLSVPVHATPVSISLFAACAVVLAPLIAFSALAAYFSGSAILVAVLLFVGILLSWLLSLLFLLILPAYCTGGARGLSAVFKSASLALRNPVSVFVWAVTLYLLLLPSFIPLLGVFYAVLFAMPLSAISLLSLFKKLK